MAEIERKEVVRREKKGNRNIRDVVGVLKNWAKPEITEIVQYLTKEEKKKVDKIRKFTSAGIFPEEDGSFDVGGMIQIASEEVEDEEIIKEKLKALGYLDRE